MSEPWKRNLAVPFFTQRDYSAVNLALLVFTAHADEKTDALIKAVAYNDVAEVQQRNTCSRLAPVVALVRAHIAHELRQKGLHHTALRMRKVHRA